LTTEAEKASNRVSTERWRINNPEKVKAAKKAFYAANRESELERVKQYHKDNADQIRIRKREQRQDPIVAARNLKYKRNRRLIDSAAKLRENRSQRDRNLEAQLEARVALGNKCSTVNCPTNTAVIFWDEFFVIQFDHIIPVRTKIRNKPKMYKEIVDGVEKNVQLLCANCHAMKTAWEKAQRCVIN